MKYTTSPKYPPEPADTIYQRLIEDGYLNVSEAPKMAAGQQPLLGQGGMAKEAAQQVQFNLTEKGIDFLGYRTLKHLLGSIGKSSFGAHDTEHLATGIEAEAASKPYEYGDTLNLDVNATLTHALQREGLGVPINLEYGDLMVHQAEYRSSSATLPDGRIYVNSMGLDPQILQATYREVALCRRSGIMINTFMLARDRSLVEFVKKVSAICRGKAYFTNTMTLGQFILMDFMRRKTRRVS